MKPDASAAAPGAASSATDFQDDRAGGRSHRHYGQWFTGDGATTEFRLGKTFSKLDDVRVYVDGVLKRPDDQGTAHHYQLRGVTGGYAGDRNTVKLSAAPANGSHVYVEILSA